VGERGPADPGRRPGVLMVTGAYYPELSGAGLQCRELIRQLGDAARVAVLTTTADRALPSADERDGVPVWRVFVNPRSRWSKLAAGLRMAAALVRERRRFSILHLHGFSQKSIVLVLFGLLTGKRIAVKLTSIGHDDPASMRDRGGMAFWCYSRAHVFFGVSPRFRSIYESSELPRDRFRLIPNGVDLARFSPASPADRRALRARLGIAADVPMLLFVGFFSREKCPDVLFEAWTRMAAAGDHTSVLVFVGGNRPGYYEVDPSLADQIRVRAGQLSLEGRLRFVDSTQEIETYYRAADIFVMPSVREGLPNALLEAMACGLACVATRLEGVTDTILDDSASGILVPPRDVPALTTALVALVGDPARARSMGARAREHVARTYSAATTAQQYLAAYRDMQAS